MRKYQYYNINDDDDRDGYGVNWMAQTFTPEATHMISKIKLKLFRVGDPGTIIVSIKNTTGGEPSGADLCSGSIEGTDITENANGEWYEITLGDGYTLTKGTQYTIVVRATTGDASNKVSWRADITSPAYTGGLYCASSDSGVDWDTYSGVDCMFEEWGAGEPSPTTVVWGNLLKSQISTEKIEEAIDRLIQGHEDDPNAHIEVGESLQSHKASTIIDHIVSSIIEDKIKDGAIVVHHLKWDKFTLTFSWDTLDGWTEDNLLTGAVELYIGCLRLTTGNTINSRAMITAMSFAEGWAVNYSKNPRFMTPVAFYGSADRIAYIVAGSKDMMGFGFKQVDDKLYAVHWKETVEYTTELLTIPGAWTWYRLKAIYTTGSKIEFYIDDVLKATHTTNLPEDDPDAGDELEWFSYSITNQVAAGKVIYVRYLVLTQDA